MAGGVQRRPDLQRHVAVLRHAAHRGRRTALAGRDEVPAEAARRASDYGGHVHRRAVGDSSRPTFPTGVCDYSKPGVAQQRAEGALADLRGRPRRPAARRPAGLARAEGAARRAVRAARLVRSAQERERKLEVVLELRRSAACEGRSGSGLRGSRPLRLQSTQRVHREPHACLSPRAGRERSEDRVADRLLTTIGRGGGIASSPRTMVSALREAAVERADAALHRLHQRHSLARAQIAHHLLLHLADCVLTR